VIGKTMADVEVPYDFPEIIPVDHKTMDYDASGILLCDWIAPSKNHPRGAVNVAWGAQGSADPDRHPILVVSVDRVADRFGVKPGDARYIKVEEAVWRVIKRILVGKLGHFHGQGPAYDTVDKMWETSGSEAMRWGLSFSIFGVEHIEKFAVPILTHVLGPTVA
jgi:hypothetical protein